jgi:hypothetical protein
MEKRYRCAPESGMMGPGRKMSGIPDNVACEMGPAPHEWAQG